MAETIEIVESLVAMTCGGCGMTFAVPQKWRAEKRESRGSFCCPNGCERIFTGKTEAERLREELERERSRAVSLNARIDQIRAERDGLGRQLTAQKGALTRVKNRVSNGVCPCCNRTFANLHRHMTTKHPEYAKPEADGKGRG